ncbi:MAG: TRM11 family SAM-dependent methyltransferase [Acidimicrobiales bacterium]
MPRYALLLKANANRVYGAAAFDLARAELAALDRGPLGGVVESTERGVIGGVDYLLLGTSAPLDAGSIDVLSNLSSLHALFGVEGDLFHPVTVRPRVVMDEDVTTIQRYSGKTNEAFTHLLVNVALAESGAFPRMLAGERVALLDPACGRGTSLNRAVVYGLDAHGIELDQRDVEAYTTFILTWMKDKRLKHQLEQAKLRKGRDTPAHRITVTYGRGKDRSAHRVVDIVHDDTLGARTHLRARAIDVVVCDLPYGVQHGSQPVVGKLDRGPAGLLRQALPVWADLLRPGGAMALAWNRNTLSRAELAGLVTGAGLELHGAADDDAFVHRVDRSILRDVLVAVRPTP